MDPGLWKSKRGRDEARIESPWLHFEPANMIVIPALYFKFVPRHKRLLVYPRTSED